MINKDLQSMDDLEQLASTQLKQLYPLPETASPRVVVRVSKRPQPRRYARTIAAGVAAIAVVAAGLGVATTFGQDKQTSQVPVAPAHTASSSAPSSPSPSASPSASSSASPTTTPAWVYSCFQKRGKVSVADKAYLGLTQSQAVMLAKHRRQQLVLVGAFGRCQTLGDLVARVHPVAVAFGRGSDGRSQVIYATSDRAAKYVGWGIP